MKKYFFIIIIIPFFNLYGFSPGVTGSTFLKLGVGARPVSLGCAYTAVSDDANAIFWNPAGLGQVYAMGGTFSFLKLFNDINYGAGAFLFRMKNLGVLGIGATFLSVSDVERNENGEETGEFSNYDLSVLLSYGKEFIPDLLYIGGTVRGIQSKLADRYGRSVTIDAGVLATPLKYIRLGASLKNIGPGVVFINERDLPPVELRSGAALVIPYETNSMYFRITLSSEIVLEDMDRFTGGIGGELMFMPSEIDLAFKGISIRGGYQPVDKTGDWSGFSFGIGTMMSLGENFYFSIDAVHYSYGFLGAADRVSFTLKI